MTTSLHSIKVSVESNFQTEQISRVLCIPVEFLQLMFLVWQVQGPCSFLSEPEVVLRSFPRPEDDSLELQAGFQHPSHLILPLLSDSVVDNTRPITGS